MNDLNESKDRFVNYGRFGRVALCNQQLVKRSTKLEASQSGKIKLEQ